jgi:hypothetical protein
MRGVVRLTKSRWPSRPLDNQPASMPPYNHPALISGNTLYPSTVRGGRNRWALKSGDNSKKIGGLVRKGPWKGFPIFTLTLEERATCPTSCHHWRSCFGNKMHWADRVAAGADLEWRLEREIAFLSAKYPAGHCVRTHVLGDFMSVSYVQFWARMLDQHPALHVWGYTARHDLETDPIARELLALVQRSWSRFAVRFSNAPQPFPAPATVTIETPLQKPADAILCPEQAGGKTESCSTCALCWGSLRRIAFLQH